MLKSGLVVHWDHCQQLFKADSYCREKNSSYLRLEVKTPIRFWHPQRAAVGIDLGLSLLTQVLIAQRFSFFGWKGLQSNQLLC